jgi:dephospho-CoA kinase
MNMSTSITQQPAKPEHPVQNNGPYRIGLTGGIGSGKSAATDYFATKGITIVDADTIAHQVSRQPEIVSEIQEHFGSQVITPENHLDRAQLRRIVFSDPEAKHWLEKLLHPRIRNRLLSDLREAKSPYVILSAPLLLENKLTPLVDRVAVIDLPEIRQRERAMARDHNTPETIDKIMQAQLSREERLAQADDILDNQGDIQALHKQIDQLHPLYLSLASSDKPA